MTETHGHADQAARGQDTPQPRTSRGDAPTPQERRQRRARFLRELAEARDLRARVFPRRTRAARMRQIMRTRTFRA